MRETRVNRNWYYDPDTYDSAPQNVVDRIKANVDAIKLSRELETEDRLPSPDEQRSLSRYSGWSGTSEFFAPLNWGHDKTGFPNFLVERWEGTYAPYFDQLKQLLSEPEIRGLYNNRGASQCTKPLASKTLWRIAQHLGFDGGRVFEPGMGIGMIQGACPEALRDRIAFTGVEQDPIAARIARKLFPDANIVNARVEDVLLENQCDLVIGHMPIGRARIMDELIDSELDLHNYFLARGLHALKPGGILVSVTSRRTLDYTMDQRRFLGSIAEFIGALRVSMEFVTVDDNGEAPRNDSGRRRLSLAVLG
jgi:hypothetical protein